MTKASAMPQRPQLLFLMSPVGSFAQSGGGGGGAGGGSAGGASAGGAASGPSAGTAWFTECWLGGSSHRRVSGVPSGPANAGGLNNSAMIRAGGNAGKSSPEPAPGTNSLARQFIGSSMTTARGQPRGWWRYGGDRSADRSDVVMDKEDKAIDRKIKSICRGC